MTATLSVISAAVLWGSSGIFIKVIGLPPMTMAFLRALVPLLFAVTIMLLCPRKHPVPRLEHLYFSGLNALRFLFLFLGLSITPISISVVIMYTWPLFTLLFEALLTHTRLSRSNLALVGLAFSGILVMYVRPGALNDANLIKGGLCLLVFGIMTGYTTLLNKRYASTFSTCELMAIQNIVPAVVFFPFFVTKVTAFTQYQVSMTALYLMLTAIIGTMAFIYGLRTLAPSYASSLCYLEVVSAVCLSTLFLQEMLTLSTVIGGGMVLTASFLTIVSPRPVPSPVAPWRPGQPSRAPTGG